MEDDIDKFILMDLLKGRLLDLKKLEEKLILSINQFMLMGFLITSSMFWANEKYYYLIETGSFCFWILYNMKNGLSSKEDIINLY